MEPISTRTKELTYRLTVSDLETKYNLCLVVSETAKIILIFYYMGAVILSFGLGDNIGARLVAIIAVWAMPIFLFLAMLLLCRISMRRIDAKLARLREEA